MLHLLKLTLRLVSVSLQSSIPSDENSVHPTSECKEVPGEVNQVCLL